MGCGQWFESIRVSSQQKQTEEQSMLTFGRVSMYVRMYVHAYTNKSLHARLCCLFVWT